ncbi:MAG: hypothetical protein NTW87_34240 [Planctomycetota bacterium]|nr:hypothetical protein [Planctomycetota bacterium]
MRDRQHGLCGARRHARDGAADTLQECTAGLAVWKRELRIEVRPTPDGVGIGARDLVKRQAFPAPEVDLTQVVVNFRL